MMAISLGGGDFRKKKKSKSYPRATGQPPSRNSKMPSKAHSAAPARAECHEPENALGICRRFIAQRDNRGDIILMSWSKVGIQTPPVLVATDFAKAPERAACI